ncbi:hypothetical protein V2J31_17155 [Bacillus safensis]|uniref:hypothetical protein n=1 Tax=Bacillus TaxID=1386 RepID=UPI001BCACE10|nr:MULTISPECIES: hypothetical protein [Bacillus]MBS4746141.1 hypothetical protein [Bacillus altitudinis]MEE3679338.1 hypothetical protein [Bacillus safensis]WMT28614.1 hypothetical protein RE735_16190 [Bacillus aerius]
MTTGFSNERSAEYIILNDLYRKFEKNFTYFYPIHFHKNRDDTMLSKSDNAKGFKLICLFSRRPKTNFIGSKIVDINFRQSIFSQSELLFKHGISTIVASPIATQIEELGFGAFCQWFEVFSDVRIDNDSVSNVLNKEINYIGEFIPKAIDDKNLLKILKKSDIYTWKEIIEIIEEWYYEYTSYAGLNMFHTYSGQKPLFLIYKL